MFHHKTQNKWAEKDYFKQKPGKFKLLNKEQNKKLLEEAKEMEKEFMEVFKSSSEKYDSRLDANLKELMAQIFDFESMK